MNCYEHTFIAKQDLSSSQQEAIRSKYEKIINNNSGKVLKIQDWGIRNLAREINNNKKGYYIHIKFDGIGKTIDELEKAENIDQSLIRYLTVKVKKHDLDKNYFDKVNNNYEKK